MMYETLSLQIVLVVIKLIHYFKNSKGDVTMLDISSLCPPHWGVDILFLLFPPSAVRRLVSHLVSRHFRQQFLSYLYQIWHTGLLG